MEAIFVVEAAENALPMKIVISLEDVKQIHVFLIVQERAVEMMDVKAAVEHAETASSALKTILNVESSTFATRCFQNAKEDAERMSIVQQTAHAERLDW